MSREELQTQTFHGLGIAPKLLERLEALKFTNPTPIQFKAIPIANGGDDVIGIAQTGTGKTLAFTLPLLQRISATAKAGLVLLPTRELAVQVEKTIRTVGAPLGVRTAMLIGGVSMGPQIKQLRGKPHVIVATPGRLLDHVEQKFAKLDGIGTLILDEADRMLDMGFKPQLTRILQLLSADRQTMLFSATMPEDIAQIARQYMRKPLRIEVAPSGTAAERVDQEVYMVSRDGKIGLLQRLLSEYKGTVLVFSRTKHGAKKITKSIRDMRHTVAEIHSNRSQAQRQEALNGFERGKYRVLVATDIAARGIDVKNIELVINFDLPDHTEDYVHRIGRTGRAGKEGKAISFACPEQRADVRSIERLIRLELPMKTPTGEVVVRQSAARPPMGRGAGRPTGHKRRFGSRRPSFRR